MDKDIIDDISRVYVDSFEHEYTMNKCEDCGELLTRIPKTYEVAGVDVCFKCFYNKEGWGK